MPDAPIVVEPSQSADASIIWLHGLGADGHDFEPVVAQLPERVTARTRFVFPHAPMQPVTINGGMLMRAWYDIQEMELSRRADENGLFDSARSASALIDAEREYGIDARRIVIAGFSQGGAVALHAGLRYGMRLAGIMALSTYLPAEATVSDERSDANADVPIMLAHGSQDPVVPLALSEQARIALTGLGYRVQCHTYAMPHSVSGEELRDIGCWLQQVLALE